jgi:HK97 family phage major capsid protein
MTTRDRVRAVEILELARQHGAEDLAAQSIAAGESVAAFRTRLLKALTLQRLGGSFSFQRLVLGMAAGSLADTEREILENSASTAGVPFDPQRIFLPWSIFTEQRQLTVGAGPASAGALVGTELAEARDVLRPWSVVARAGITILDRLAGNSAIPLATVRPTAQWLTSESTPAEESMPTLAQATLTPRTVAAVVSFSRLLSKQANIEVFLRRHLLSTVGAALDRAVLIGTGTEEPLGITGQTGVGTVAGAGFAWADAVGMKRAVAVADADDSTIAWIGHPLVRELLEQREKVTNTGQFIWADDMVASRDAHVTTLLDDDALIAGAWSEAVLGLWGSGFVFELNPFDPDGFRAGITQARCIVTADVAVTTPAAFSVATAIT